MKKDQITNENKNDKANSDKLEILSLQLKELIKQQRTTKIKSVKQALNIEINSIKKEINSLLKARAKPKNNIFSKKTKKIKVLSYQLEKKEFKSSLLKMMKPYSITKRRIIFPLIIVLGLLCAISTLFFVQNTGLFGMGVTGILQSIARIAKTSLSGNENMANIIYNILFWTLYFIFNIPLLIFSYFKISRQFTILTAIYICCVQIFGLALSFIPGINNVFIFGEVANDNGVNIVKWSASSSVMPLFFYAIIQGLVLGLSYSIIYMLGSSTGGTDIITFYFAKVKSISISKLIIYFNSICIAMSAFLGTICPLFISHNYHEYFPNDASIILQSIFSPNLMFSLIIAIVSAVLIGLLFPKNKVIKVNIYSNNLQEIQKKLFTIGYQQSISINNTVGGYLWTSNQNIETICLYFQLPEIVSSIREIDKEALIVTQKITDIDGKILVVSK